MANGSMRDKMPITAEWIDKLRKTFGAEHIDQQIRRGMRGEPVFFTSENGFTVGTPSPPRVRVQWDKLGHPYVVGSEQDKQGQ